MTKRSEGRCEATAGQSISRWCSEMSIPCKFGNAGTRFEQEVSLYALVAIGGTPLFIAVHRGTEISMRTVVKSVPRLTGLPARSAT
jgi:hypothetical protein